MVRQRVVLDIDGVLAEFNEAFRVVLQKRVGAKMKELGEGPTCWEWPVEYGATQAEYDQAWKYVEFNPEWWGDLSVHKDIAGPDGKALVAEVCLRHEVTFVTSRPNGRAATLRWLARHFDADGIPCIITPHVKIPALVGLSPAIVVEDKIDTLANLDAAWHGKSKVPEKWLIDRPYNRVPNEGMTRFKTTREALERLLA